jgi:hypothetical protein
MSRIETARMETGLKQVEGTLETFCRLVRVRLYTLLRWPLFVDWWRHAAVLISQYSN